MSNTVAISVIKANDEDYFEALRRLSETPVARELGFTKLSLTPVVGSNFDNVSFEEAAASDDLQTVLNANGRTFRTFTLKGGSQHLSITVNRTDDFQHGDPKGVHDRLTLNMGPQVNDSQQAKLATLFAEIQRAFKSLSIDSLGPLLGEAAQRHLAAREEALTRLETMHSRVLHDFEEQRTRLYADLNEKESRIASAFEQKTASLEEEFQRRSADLDKREQELSHRQKALDDRSSTHVRRELREKLKEILTERQKSFSLSKDTQSRRRFVFWTYVVLLAFFAAPAAIFLYRELEASTWNPWTFGRQVAFSLAFVVTAGFFLRWLNRWAQQHADEEFKLKELEVDIDRASWVVEMALEWRAEKGEDIPAHLVERLSANLFGAKSSALPEISMTAADAITNILMNTAARAKLTLPGGEVELDKRALQKLSKDTKDND